MPSVNLAATGGIDQIGRSEQRFCRSIASNSPMKIHVKFEVKFEAESFEASLVPSLGSIGLLLSYENLRHVKVPRGVFAIHVRSR